MSVHRFTVTEPATGTLGTHAFRVIQGTGVPVELTVTGASALDDLTDVVIATPVAGNALVYNGTNWANAVPAGGGDMLAASNLSELVNKTTARSNLGVAIGTDVQAFDADLAALAAANNSTVLAATTASFLIADESKLDAIAAGAEVNTVTPTNTVSLTNKTLVSYTNTIAADGLHLEVYNNTGTTIAKGTPVYISGANIANQLPEVAPADALALATMPAIGLAHATIGTGTAGSVDRIGRIETIDTSAFTIGDILYVSETTGSLTASRPAAPAISQQIATCLYSHATLGVLDVSSSDALIPATTTAVGGVELATDAETITGTDTERAVTPAGLTATLGDLGTQDTITVPGDITATGTPSGTTYLRGDGAWATPSGGSGGVTLVTPSGAASGAANTATIQAALTAATPGTTVRVAPGSYTVDLVAHPNTNGAEAFGNCALAVKTGTTLDLTGVTLTLGASSTVNTTSAINRFITNWIMQDTATVDKDITITGGFLDGNAVNVGSAGPGYRVCGIQLWRVNRPKVRNSVVFNCYGVGAAALENFHIDFIRCFNFVAQDCVGSGGAGSTSTMFSANYSQGGAFINCLGVGSSTAHGFTIYSCSDIDYVACRAYDNAAKGFNCEHSWNVTYTGCHSGGIATTITDGSGNPATFTQSDPLGNGAAGFHIQLDKGGGNISLVSCTSIGNTTAGLFIFSSTVGTATTGTTGSTIVLSTSTTVWKQMIGRYVTVNNGLPVRITAVDEATETITTSAAHGGASGNEVVLFTGLITASNCNFDRNTTYGVQIADTDEDARAATATQLRLRYCTYRGNTSGSFAGLTGGSQTAIGDIESNLKLPDACTNEWATTVLYRNPFPFDCQVSTRGVATVATRLRGFGSSNTWSTGINNGVFLVPVGSSIEITATDVPYWFPIL